MEGGRKGGRKGGREYRRRRSQPRALRFLSGWPGRRSRQCTVTGGGGPLEGLHHAEVLVKRHAAVAVDVGLAHQQLRRRVARRRVAHARQQVAVHVPPQLRRRQVPPAAPVHGEEVGARVLQVEGQEDGVEHAGDEGELRHAVADGGGLLEGAAVVGRRHAGKAVLVDVGEADGLEQAAGVGHEHLVLHGDLEEVEEVHGREKAVLAEERGEEVALQLPFNLLGGMSLNQADLQPDRGRELRRVLASHPPSPASIYVPLCTSLIPFARSPPSATSPLPLISSAPLHPPPLLPATLHAPPSGRARNGVAHQHPETEQNHGLPQYALQPKLRKYESERTGNQL